MEALIFLDVSILRPSWLEILLFLDEVSYFQFNAKPSNAKPDFCKKNKKTLTFHFPKTLQKTTQKITQKRWGRPSFFYQKVPPKKNLPHFSHAFWDLLLTWPKHRGGGSHLRPGTTRDGESVLEIDKNRFWKLQNTWQCYK